jgi:hypothetical protein
MESNESTSKRPPQGARKNQRNHPNDPQRLGEPQGQSREIGDDPRKINNSDSQGRAAGCIKGDRKATPGGILRQLKSLRETHLAYALAHGQRLEARLEENKAYVRQINEELDGLEQQIASLLNAEDFDQDEEESTEE